MFWRFQNRIDWENIGDAETFLFFSNTFSMKLVVIQLSENKTGIYRIQKTIKKLTVIPKQEQIVKDIGCNFSFRVAIYENGSK